MAHPVLVPVDQSAVHPSMTVEEVVEDFLDTARAPRNGLTWSSIEDTKEEVIITASARRTFNFEDIAAAGRVVVDALYSGKLHAYVRDEEDREYYRVRRDYWQDMTTDDEGCVAVVPPFSCRDGDWRKGVLGQVILISRADFQEWRPSGLVSYGVASAAKPVPKALLRDYIKKCVSSGVRKETACSTQSLRAAFPDAIPPGRAVAREIYAEEFRGEIRPGRPKGR